MGVWVWVWVGGEADSQQSSHCVPPVRHNTLVEHNKHITNDTTRNRHTSGKRTGSTMLR